MNTVQQMVAAMIDLGLTQTQIADESGVTQPTVSRAFNGNGVSYENGKRLETLYERLRRADHNRRKGDKQ